MRPVALVSAPTLSGRFPSFQLALLKPLLEQHGIPAQSFSLFMYFGDFVGWRVNEALADVWPCLVGEWIWGKAAFGDVADHRAYFDAYDEDLRVICSRAGCTVDDLLRVRERTAPEFLDYVVDTVDWRRFGLIGFSVCFQQMLASIALARAIKTRHPEIPIVFGGATFEDDIAEQIVRACPEVDYVHCGDAERTFPELVKRVNQGRAVDDLPGIMRRARGQHARAAGPGGIAFRGRAPNLEELDETPVPDFDEHFYAMKESRYARYSGAQAPLLPIETARGCWWGMKNHCTFCGLNRSGVAFRAKSPENVLSMLRSLSERYGINHFYAIDNIIAPEYIEELFGRLADEHTDLRMHYEVRPSLTRHQLRRMREGGLYSVQPGVESLSTNVLRLMKKHTTGMKNLELIKWCTYYGINNLYNILMGFAGERPEDYALQAGVVEKIPHLQPPYAIAPARADRGSPMFEEPAEHQITRLEPQRCYRYLYPADRFDLRHVSYYFEHDVRHVVDAEGRAPLVAAVARWQRAWERRPRPRLTYAKTWQHVVIDDRRGERPRSVELAGRAAALYEHLADARPSGEVRAAFADVADVLDQLLAQDLVIELDDRLLALALPDNPYH
ncbi:MAG: hypothetical protein A2138_27880 [Deltaproteobacteria bacterium RBG_16_71_12]|nr:MAG: hypothetical protein A2138_27880 [Deltaproteobacteria bacterium RBG_16_71_12]